MLANLQVYLEVGLQLLGGLVILGTLIVRLTPSKKDDAVVEKMEGFWAKAVMFLPTLGVNPKTKELKAALEALKK